MRTTLAQAVEVVGVGVHSGRPARVVLAPAASGAGWWLNGAPLAPTPCAADGRCTAVASPRGRVHTVEHLFAALVIAGVDDVAVTVEALASGEALAPGEEAEVPILDGSAAGWLARLAVAPQPGARPSWRVERPIRVGDAGRWIAAEPAAALSLEVTVDHPPPRGGGPARRWHCRVALAGAATALAPARTYGFWSDAEAIRAAGLARGADALNTRLLDAQGRESGGGAWTLPDEPARHKALDLLGDLAFLGAPLRARIVAFRPGHALNAALVAALRAGARCA